MAKREENSLAGVGELNSIIGRGAVLEGKLEVQSSIRVDGRVKGSVKSSDTIVVGKDGVVEGDLTAKNVVVGGEVNGKIDATGRVVLESTSTFTGDLKTGKLVIDEGAVFDGQCSMKAETGMAPPAMQEKGKQ